MVVCPERTRVARACPWAPGRIVQLADACFHGRSVAAGNRAAIRDRAALQCGELPRVVQSSDASAARPRELDVDSRAPGSSTRPDGGSDDNPRCSARNGARYRPAIFPGGHHRGSMSTSDEPARGSDRRNRGRRPVRRRPRSTGRNGRGSISAPASAAIHSAAASACCAAIPPCLIGNAVMSPTAKTSSRPSTRPCSSTGTNPRPSCRIPGSDALRAPGWRQPAVSGSPDRARRQVHRRETRPASSACGPRSCSRPAPPPPSRKRPRQNGERTGLGRHEPHMNLRGTPILEHRLRHQGELVERKRPRRLAGQRKGDRGEPTGRHGIDDLSELLALLWSPEGEPSGHALARSSANGEDEHLPGDFPAVGGMDSPAREIDARKRTLGGAGAGQLDEPPDGERADFALAERLRNGERLVDEVGFGSEHLDVDALFGDCLQASAASRAATPAPAIST